MRYGAGERVRMTKDWILMDGQDTQLASKGEGAVILNFRGRRRYFREDGEPLGYQILLDSGQELGVYPEALEPE